MRHSARDVVGMAIDAADLHEADVVLVQPPFASPDRPSLGLHILKGIAAAHGVRATVLYSNLSFARLIGPRLYRRLCHTPTEDLSGERLFRTAWPGSAVHGPGSLPDRWEEIGLPAADFFSLQKLAATWSKAMAAALAEVPAEMIGFSSSFEQTLPSLAMAAHLKARVPGKTTLLGGANADDIMGEGLAAVAPEIDHVFQGEAEGSFADFLSARAGGASIPRVLRGHVNNGLESLPPPDYADFFRQWTTLVGDGLLPDCLDHADIRLPYESSRGCWWGEKHHCTFCGLNANGMKHRIKSPTKVEREITALSETYGVSRILMVDNIMPHTYFSTLLPNLARAERRLEIFYEQKANLGRRRMALLRNAGVTSIQPGIEALSTSLLKRMNKGTSLRVNLDCLRHARAAGISLAWNLLSDFPGDCAQDYQQTVDLIPLLHHLEPPGGLGGLSLDRFSPYQTKPEAYGISDMKPLRAYEAVFPARADQRLAYHFQGEYSSALRRDRRLKKGLEAALEDWSKAWAAGPPIFQLFDLSADAHLLVDTRSCSTTNEARLLGRSEAELLLKGTHEITEIAKSAIDRGELAWAEGSALPVACAVLESSAWTAPPTHIVEQEESAGPR